VAGGTIEDTILSLHDQKRDLVAGILEGADAAARLSTRELLQLVRTGEAPAATDEPDDRAGEEEVAEAPGGTEGRSLASLLAPPPPPPAALPASPAELAVLVAEAEKRLAAEGLAAGTRDTYSRELHRFLEAQREASNDGPLRGDVSQRVRHYLTRLELGQIKVPRGTLAVARAALSRLAPKAR
jgi:hypothetical protein